MPKRVGKNGELFRKLISDDNLREAIVSVNLTHHWVPGHRPNPCTAWVELTMEDRIVELRKIISRGFIQSKPRISEKWDAGARKWRTICEPKQWPDQYVHHALVQVLQPVFMRGMDIYCCGSIRGRGSSRVKNAIESWMKYDTKGTRYELSADIRHFYERLRPKIVMERMRHLIKDARVLDLIWRVIRRGIKIGFYTSQWFANVVLQPLDMMIRQTGYCAHYVRYIDNITVFGSNKRKLHRLRKEIVNWLLKQGLFLKPDWQIFRTEIENDKTALSYPRRGYTRPKFRLPDSVGYRYGRGYTLPRKHNFIRLKRALSKYRKKRDAGKRIQYRFAAGIMSRIGQIKYSSNRNIYQIIFKGERIQSELKRIIRAESRKEQLQWTTYLESLAKTKLLQPKEALTQT